MTPKTLRTIKLALQTRQLSGGCTPREYADIEEALADLPYANLMPEFPYIHPSMWMSKELDLALWKLYSTFDGTGVGKMYSSRL